MSIPILASRSLPVVTAVFILGISGGAQALCLNQDGSLDDVSMNTESLDAELLPSCDSQQSKPVQSVEPRTLRSVEPTVTAPPENAKAATRKKVVDSAASGL